MALGWLLLLMALATYRLTRLIAKDDLPLVRIPREWIVRKEPKVLGELVECPWCVSVWASAGVTVAVDLFTSVPLPVLVFGGIAGASALLSHLELQTTAE